MAEKVWGSLMMIGASERRQRRVIMFSHLKDFMAATRITRAYISDTGNEQEISAATANPGVLMVEVGDDYSGEFMPIDQHTSDD